MRTLEQHGKLQAKEECRQTNANVRTVYEKLQAKDECGRQEQSGKRRTNVDGGMRKLKCEGRSLQL